MSSNAQTPCPVNGDFESGNYSNWNYYVGTCCPIAATSSVSTPPTSTYIPCSFALTGPSPAVSPVIVTGVDPFGGFPVVGNGVYSLRIGSNRTNYWAEKTSYSVHVPAGITGYGLLYRFAIVLEDPGHIHSAQPRFDITATDSNTNTILPCYNYDYVAGAVPGFIGPVSNAYGPIPSYGCSDQIAAAVSGWDTDVYYMPWKTSNVNLSGYGGHTIIMSFSAGDCGDGGHFGYGYIDMSCGLFAITTTAASCASTVQLAAPAGFSNYVWYDSSTFTTLYGVADTISIPTPSSPTVLAVVMSPYAGFGCPDTLYMTVNPATCTGIPAAGVINPTATSACASSLFTLTDVGYTTGISYQWQSSPDSVTWNDITGATNTSYTSTGISATTYYRLVDSCCVSGLASESAGVKITYTSCCIGTISGASTVSVGNTAALSETISGGTWSSGNTAIATIDLSTGVYTGVSIGTAVITYAVGCGGTTTYTVTVTPINGISGHVTFTGGVCPANVKVWLITYNSGTSDLEAIDSALIPCSGASSVYYQYRPSYWLL